MNVLQKFSTKGVLSNKVRVSLYADFCARTDFNISLRRERIYSISYNTAKPGRLTSRED